MDETMMASCSVIRPIPRFDFDVCPICFSASNLTDEHVPPEALGGKVLTRTCRRCNNTLGSRVDEPFRNWMLQRFMSARFELPDTDLRGRRVVRSLQYRVSEDGTEGFYLDATNDPELMSAIRQGGGRFRFVAQEPMPHAVWLGEFKSLYLASCVSAERILEGASANRVRELLVEALEPGWTPVGVESPFAGLRSMRLATLVDVARPASYAWIETRDVRVPAIAWSNYASEMPFQDDPGMPELLSHWPEAP
jgi:HNH endonuclease